MQATTAGPTLTSDTDIDSLGSLALALDTQNSASEMRCGSAFILCVIYCETASIRCSSSVSLYCRASILYTLHCEYQYQCLPSSSAVELNRKIACMSAVGHKCRRSAVLVIESKHSVPCEGLLVLFLSTFRITGYFSRCLFITCLVGLSNIEAIWSRGLRSRYQLPDLSERIRC